MRTIDYTTVCIPFEGFYRRWLRLKHLLTIFLLYGCMATVLLLNFKTANAQGPCGTSNCTSGDIRITKVELLKSDGTALPNSCDPGQLNIQVQLRVTFDVTSTTRYGFLVVGKVYINNTLAGTIANCDPSTFSQGVHTMDVDHYTTGDPISWACGSTIQLKEVYTAWDQQAASATNPGVCTYLNSDGTISNCGAIDPKCKFYGDNEAITVYAPLIANFTWLASCVSGHTAQTVAFTNTTSGGKSPYTYVWDFGDGSATSTAANPTHDYTAAGNYTVTLTSTDATTPTGQVDVQQYSINVTSCCTPPTLSSSPADQTKCEGLTASFTVGYSGGTPAPSIQWQVNTGSGFTNISNGGVYSGATTATLTITGVTPSINGYTYRAVLQSGTCTAVITNPATLNVSAATNAGTLSGAKTICTGSNSGLLTLSGYTGSIVRWESSADGNAPWTAISNTAATFTSGALSADIWFRAVVKSGVCDAMNSNAVKITVQQPPSVTSNPSDQTKCEGATATFSVSYSGGVPAPAIQWQENSGSGFVNITDGGKYSGSTTGTLTVMNVVPSMNNNTYRATLQSGTCLAVNSTQATLYVNAATNAGTLNGAKTICSGSNSGVLTLTGYTGTILRWESSPNGSSPWTAINNTTSTFTSGALSSDTWFRAVVKSGVCDEMNSNGIKITVQQPITSNTIGASQTICSGNAPAGLTGSLPAGGDGSFQYQWQWKAGGGSFANIPGANNKDYGPGALSQTTDFRRLVTAGVCSVNASDAVTITISPESVVYSLYASNYCASNPDKGVVTLSGSYPGVSYQLKKQSDNSDVQAPIIGTGSSLTWTNVDGGTYYVLGTGVAPTYCQSITAAATVHEFDCSQFYTLTQGYYGSKNGKTCIGTTPVNTIRYLLGSTNIVAGTTNSVVVPASDDGAKKLNSVMPGGGTPLNLPGGNCTITDNTCFKQPAYLTKQGKINDVLLSQTITLDLNTRWDGGRLLLFHIESGWLTTQKLNGCGTDAVVVTDCTNGTISSIKMNQNVVDYLGANNTVQDLLNLAKGVLGGTLTPGQNGVPSYSDVNDAVDAINQSFDEGRRLLDYYPDKQTCESLFPVSSTLITPYTTMTQSTMQASLLTQGISVKAYPNPYTDRINFTVESDVSGSASLQVYNLMGQKVKTVYQGFINAGKQSFTLNLPVQQRSSLIYVFTIGNKRMTGKLLQLNK